MSALEPRPRRPSLTRRTADSNQQHHEPLPPLVFKKPRRKSSEVVRAHGCVLCEKRYGTRAALSLHFKLKHELPLRTKPRRCGDFFVFVFLSCCGVFRAPRAAVRAVRGGAARAGTRRPIARDRARRRRCRKKQKTSFFFAS